MTVDELNTKMEGEFGAVRKDMDAGFAAVRKDMDAGFVAVRKDMDAGFVAVRKDMQAEFSAVRTELRAEIKAEGEITRRHFDVMVEKMKDVVKVIADGTARNTERLNDHERRLTAIEKQPH
jgi:hypothetical protein